MIKLRPLFISGEIDKTRPFQIAQANLAIVLCSFNCEDFEIILLNVFHLVCMHYHINA